MIYELMESRRSVRKFRPKIPSRNLIEQLIRAAITAPSASNKQPWRFVVLSDVSVKKRLVIAVQDAVDLIAQHIDPDFENSFRAYGDYFTRFGEAPVVIIPLFRPLHILSNMIDDDLGPSHRESIKFMEYNSGLVSTSLAMQNILLMAHELGLGASGMTGPLVAVDSVRNILKVPKSWDVVAFIPVGFPDEEPDPPPRKPLDTVLKWIEPIETP